MILLANTAVMAQIPTDGLIGYWPFNGNADDASGNNNNGILEGESQNPQLATDRFGTANGAYEFGGYYNKNWIRVPNNSSMQLGSRMSISFWYQQCEFSGMNGYGNYSTTNAVFSLFSKAGDGISAYPGIYIYNGINSQTGNVNIYSANCNGNATYYQNYGISTEYHCFDLCEWMHYVTVIDDDVAKIYINGILYSISNINHADFTQANVQDIYLGRMGCSGTIWYPFHGKMDDVAFYNRALTEAEVAQLFDNYYDPHYFDNQIIIENLIVQKACNGNDGSVQVFVNPDNGPYQYALDQPTNYQVSNLLENIGEGYHRIYIKSDCGLKDTLVDFTCFDIPFPDNIDSADCVFFPTATEWGINVGWSSGSIVSNLNIPLVGDLDNDGHPEIICFSAAGDTQYNPNTNNQMLVFDGVTKQLKTTITMSSPVTAYDAAAYGMVKLPTGKGLIVAACYDYKLRAYDITAVNPSTPFWTSDVDYGSNYGDWGVNVSFADFNHDGHPEVYVRNKIYNAETGTLLVSVEGSENTGSSYCHYTQLTNWKLSAPLASNVCNDSRLELILGNEVYNVNITNLNGTSGNTITLASQITPQNGVPADGNVQVADFNADGYLDIFISIRNTNGYYGTVYCYVWDIHNNTVSVPLTINTSFSGKSIPMIADVDNDGLMEILIQCDISNSYEKFQAYKYHPNTQSFTFLWGFATDEDSYSNSITSFDFNQDGLLELMICDQSTVRIVNGSGYSHITGNDTIPVYVMSSFPFSETTIMQYPIIVDVDDDGNAEIVSVGNDKLNIFESSTSPWAPTRKVWNQYMYNVTNINNDLTIPQYLFNNATPFSDPQNVVRRPFNNFLQQATTIDQYGRPFYAVPDAAALSANITISGTDAVLNVTYINQGDNTLNAPYHITVFANLLGGTVVQTFTVNTSLPIDGTIQQSLALPLSTLCQIEGLNSLVVAINCDGGGIAQNGNQQPECDVTNNTAQVAINLQTDPTYISETACDEFVWNGSTYSQSGQYQQTLSNSYGCDSLIILDLTVNHSDTVNYTVTACESYTWNGQTYTQSGNYTHTTTNESGCDRLENLYLTISDNYRQVDEVSECDNYYWPQNQQWYYQSTFDSLVVQGNPGECDSTFVLELTIRHSDTVNYTVTACESYAWNGQMYTQSGNYTHTTTNESGCERLEILALTISDGFREVEAVSECDSYYWPQNQQWYYQSTLDSLVVLGNPGECDSTFVLELTIRHSDTVSFATTTCEGYTWNGQTYTQTGSYMHTTTNDFGCDRLEILELVINHSSEYEFSVTSCESYEWYGTIYDEPGVYMHTLTGPYNCDSVLIMHLDIGEIFVMEENVESCNSYEWQGTTYTQGGDYQHEIENANGCDSIFILHLKINEAVYHEIEHETCSPYTWNGITYDEEGIYEQTFISSTGCDSVVSLHLVMGAATERPIHGVGSIYPSTDMVLGVYSYYIDSTDINPSNVHWSVDREGWLLIPHGAKCDLVCTSTGRAELHAWTEGEQCNIDAMMQLNATFFGVEEEGVSLKVYPNPTKGRITIEWEEIQIVNVYDLLGQKLMGYEFDKENVCVLDLSRFQGSVYMLEVVSSTGRIIRPIVLTQ